MFEDEAGLTHTYKRTLQGFRLLVWYSVHINTIIDVSKGNTFIIFGLGDYAKQAIESSSQSSALHRRFGGTFCLHFHSLSEIRVSNQQQTANFWRWTQLCSSETSVNSRDLVPIAVSFLFFFFIDILSDRDDWNNTFFRNVVELLQSVTSHEALSFTIFTPQCSLLLIELDCVISFSGFISVFLSVLLLAHFCFLSLLPSYCSFLIFPSSTLPHATPRTAAVAYSNVASPPPRSTSPTSTPFPPPLPRALATLQHFLLVNKYIDRFN
jgi:hypothetical protein